MQTLFAVAAPQNLAKYALTDCTAGPVDGAVQLSFGHAQVWPHIKFPAAKLGYSTDWSKAAFLAVTVSNPSVDPVKVNIRVDTRADKYAAQVREEAAAPW